MLEYTPWNTSAMMYFARNRKEDEIHYVPKYSFDSGLEP